MIKGKTKSGFEFEIEEKRLNNMELIEALADSVSNQVMISRVIVLLLGNEQKKKLYDFFRTEDGLVPTDAVCNAVVEIFNSIKDGKNC